MQDLITPVHAAIINGTRTVEFLVGPSNGMGKVAGSAGRQEVVYARSLQVPGFSLDDFVYQQGNPLPQAVKMDIEGGEVLALPGMQRILHEAHPLLMLELHGPESAEVARTVLIQAGYRLHSMTGGYPDVTAAEKLDWKVYLIAR